MWSRSSSSKRGGGRWSRGVSMSVLGVAVFLCWASLSLDLAAAQGSPCEYPYIPWPIAVFTNIIVPGRCSGGSSFGIATANATDIPPQGFFISIPDAYLSRGLRTVNTQDQLFHTVLGAGLGTPMLLTLSLSVTPYSNYGSPFGLYGNIVAFQPISISNLELSTGLYPTILDISFHSSSNVMYFVVTYEKAGKTVNHNEIAVGTLNTQTGVAELISNRVTYKSYEVPDGSLSTRALDSIKNNYYFAFRSFTLQGEKSGVVFTYSIAEDTLTQVQFDESSEFWNCTDWAFDLFSGNVYGTYYLANHGGIGLAIVDPTTATLTPVGTLVSEYYPIASGTLSFDYIIGMAYFAYEMGDHYVFNQFDPTTATIYATGQFNNSNSVSMGWAAYATWLSL